MTKDLKEKRVLTTHYLIVDFVDALADHVPDRYQHAMRYFGLLAPRSKDQTFAAVFVLLGQKQRRRPQRLSWRESLRKCFGMDPLIDSHGQLMHWIGRLGPRLGSGTGQLPGDINVAQWLDSHGPLRISNNSSDAILEGKDEPGL